MNSKKYKDTLYEVREVKDLRELLEGSIAERGDKAAFLVKSRVTKEFEPISYNKLQSDYQGLGTSFIKMGLRNHKIAVIGENSYDWVITYFATVNGVGVIVPIDRELKAKEILNLLERSGVSAIVYSKKLKNTIMEIKDQVPGLKYVIEMNKDKNDEESLGLNQLIKEGHDAVKAGERAYLDATIDPEEMCTLLFTSGTTGLAKGVMLSQQNILANVINMSKYVKIPEDGIGLSVLPMHHSYEMTCHIFTAMYQGLTVAICEGLKYIQKNMAEVHANVMLAVPLIFETIHKKIWKQIEAKGQLKKVKRAVALSKKLKLYNKPAVVKKMFAPIHAITGGEITHFIAGGAAINPQVIEDFQAMGFPMFQGYGMTENAPIIAVNKDRYSKSGAAGLPMPGTEVRVINKDDDGIGEIICKGPSVMLGYYDNDQATAETIMDGWLLTGDYGYFDEDGFLYVSGRKKNVIVTKNGKNIFPEEVEFYLSESDYIEECLVHGIEDQRTGDTVVKAEIYPNFDLIKEEKGELSDGELREFLKELIDDINEQMPLYKRVKRFDIRRVEFEKTTTRKIKRFAEANLSKDID